MIRLLKVFTFLILTAFTLSAYAADTEKSTFLSFCESALSKVTRTLYLPFQGSDILASIINTPDGLKGDFRSSFNIDQMRVVLHNRHIKTDDDFQNHNTSSPKRIRDFLPIFVENEFSFSETVDQNQKDLVKAILDNTFPDRHKEQIWVFQTERKIALYMPNRRWPKWFDAKVLLVVKGFLVVGQVNLESSKIDFLD